MARGNSSAIAAVMMAALLLLAAGRVAEGQSSDCAVKLVPCADYLNSTNPSSECCEAIKTVVTTQLPCLCGLIRNPSALAGINITQALELPKHCGLPSDTSACNAALAPGSSSLPPPATPGGNNGNAGGRVSQMGIPAILLASAFAFFY
ncbi:non-specific lipid transfer protein GPI-anchored 7-like [Salvia miltiorrhiza]|uniref:non-specific lipid transfer protein GPI-anchored 7-like n=1 Tax=Salvia miltiorrhiza TaxID=226208 RepID=UPI0025AB7C68|nr:non-specific lipid transfer protein GPI-anchored 7-like [Salvia miltiorrhiza]